MTQIEYWNSRLLLEVKRRVAPPLASNGSAPRHKISSLFDPNKVSNLESAFLFIFKEARFRILWWFMTFFLTFIICYVFSEELFFLLAKPFLQVVLLVNFDVVKGSQYSSFLFLSTRLTESLNTYLTSSFVISCVFCFPILWYQIGCFFLPSLSLSQRQKFLRLSLMSLFAFLFVLGISFLFILPSVCAFLYKCSSISSKIFSIQMQPTIYEFVVVTLRFLVLSALLSQVPVFLLWIIQWDTSILQDLTRQRQRIWICCILLSAFLTPPDIACQFFSSLFMFIVLEITFFYAFLRIHYQTIKK